MDGAAGVTGAASSCLQPVNSTVPSKPNIATIENNFFIVVLASETTNRRTSLFLGGGGAN